MKIQCDVCNEHEAEVYCLADEAALCCVCDQRVHHANKLAGKHERFDLLHPPPTESPMCDICQEKKAFLFCQQDRAILCKDCDVGIHKVNQHTQKHNRFLLTGVKLSSTASAYSASTTPTTTNTAVAKPGVLPDQQLKQLPLTIMNKNTVETQNRHQELNGLGHESTTSSISEYLIETLPGWHVEDFLDPPPSLSKVYDNNPWPVWGEDLLDGSFNNSFTPESMGIWVPQAPREKPRSQYAHVLAPGSNTGFGDQTLNGSSLSFAQNKITKGSKTSRKWTQDNGNCFTVPQISPSSMSSKRSRTLWH
ncbi:hypothetical protein M8C21_001538 [Ambrosia artemisiifolia]|uniref:B box-type domain-containing protein n=1 Tax=Ambrosia artemisiifolia TaxID=4212 RepID=A0AAD5DB74_AMBAR|nr:hypothetical protein M8C21_001538 [Ambrosia artemisiifolia]